MRADPRIIRTEGAFEEALEGARTMYSIVSKAYGPTSFNIALQKSYGSHTITHDGVSIARDIVLADQDHNIGSDLLYAASKKTEDIAGDGTTLTIVLGYHIMLKAKERIAAGFNPMKLRRGIDWAGRKLVDELDGLAKPVKTERLHEVATISAADPEVGKLVADTVIKTKGIGITVEDYEGVGVHQDIIEGMYFEQGWSDRWFITDQVLEEAVQDNMSVLCLEKRIRTNQELIPILEMIEANTEHKGVLIVGDITGKALDTCIATNNHPKGSLRICVVKPPAFGSQRAPFMQDIAVMTGGKLVPQDLPANKVSPDFLGFTKKMVVTSRTTTLIEPQGITEDVSRRIEELNEQLNSNKYNAAEKERMEKRMSKLQGRIGIIRVGGATEQIAQEMKGRVIDAVNAARGAHEEGIVPGGGITLARLSKGVSKKKAQDEFDLLGRHEQEGAKLVFEALQEPFKKLMSNAGEDPGSFIRDVLKSKPGYGYDVNNMTEEPIDLIAAGVVDPVRVIKSAVENACSVSAIVITLGGSTKIDRKWQLEQLQLNRLQVQG
jgi:chaperonin GroEL